MKLNFVPGQAVWLDSISQVLKVKNLFQSVAIGVDAR